MGRFFYAANNSWSFEDKKDTYQLMGIRSWGELKH